MKLVPDWKQGWRWFSVHAHLAQLAVIATWGEVPADARSSVPANIVVGVVALIGVLGLLGRFVDQGGPNVSAQ